LELQRGILMNVNNFTTHSKYELLRCYLVSDVDFMSSTPPFLTLRIGNV